MVILNYFLQLFEGPAHYIKCYNPDCLSVCQMHRIKAERAKQLFLLEDWSKCCTMYM